MASTLLFDVEFFLTKPAPVGTGIIANQIVLPSRRAVVTAASPAGVLAVLNANISLNAGEQINISRVFQVGEVLS
jgi:hypothetical protein